MRQSCVAWSYRVASLVIFGGFLMLLQPFTVTLYSYGFPVLLLGSLCFIALDHVPKKWTENHEATGNGDKTL